MSVLPDFFLDLLKKYFVRNKDRFNNLMKTDPFIDLTGYYNDSDPINDKINIIYPQINIHEKAIQLITLLLDEVRNNRIDIYEEFRDKDIDFFEKYEPENLKNIYREKHRKILAINKLPQYLEFEDKFINDVTNICREIFSGDKSKIIDLNDFIQNLLSALANKKDNEIILFIIEIKNLYTSHNILQQLDTWLNQYGNFFVSPRLLESWINRSSRYTSNTNKIESSLLIQIHDFTAKYLNLEAWFWSYNHPQKCSNILKKQEREYRELPIIIDNLLKTIDKNIPGKYKTNNTRTTLNDGLYRYDAIGRLQDAQIQRDSQKKSEQKLEENIGKYIQLGALGTAFLPNKKPRVLLIDEVDKSDIDLPNDLLNLFEEGEYEIPELARIDTPSISVRTYDNQTVIINQGQVTCTEFPLVIMTSNAERDFPPAFLRRCLQLEMPEPKKERLTKIVESHFNSDTETLTKAKELIDEFISRRDRGQNIATDQLLNVIFMLKGKQQFSEKEKKILLEHLLQPLDRVRGNYQ